MANIKFYLNRGIKVKDTTKPQVIYLRYVYGRSVNYQVSLRFKVLVDDWDEDNQKVKNRSHILNRTNINNRLADLKTEFEKYENKLIENGEQPTKEGVKIFYKSLFKEPEPDKKQLTLFSYIDDFIHRPETKREITKRTIQTYERSKTFLKRFNDEVYKIDFDTINLEFYNDFVEWCESQNLSVNYIGKHIKTLKTFMNNALEEGVTDNASFKSKRFKVLKEPSENVYLNETELRKIWSLDLSKDERKETARDLFLIGAYTGLRVSDYNNLSDENITTVNDVKMIKIKTRKTKKEVAIPLHPIVEQILEKNDGKPPKRMPDQHINYKIKDVCEDAGIDEPTYITKTKGGKEVKVKKYKFELVKTHTARRSFCTNAYFSGMQPIDIMSISGHTTEKAFLTYIKRTPEQTAIKMAQHPFFKNANALKVS